MIDAAGDRRSLVVLRHLGGMLVPRRIPRVVLALAGVTLVAAAAPTLRPGLWEVASAPGTASLDGRPLKDLPYTPDAPRRVCLSAAEATDPAAWFARDTGPGCTLTSQSVRAGKVLLAGTCMPQAEGLAPGSVRVTGTWQPERYALRFATINNGENGRMGFTGTLHGHRVGDCPAS